jgi:hypothetical protein
MDVTVTNKAALVHEHVVSGGVRGPTASAMRAAPTFSWPRGRSIGSVPVGSADGVHDSAIAELDAVGSGHDRLTARLTPHDIGRGKNDHGAAQPARQAASADRAGGADRLGDLRAHRASQKYRTGVRSRGGVPHVVPTASRAHAACPRRALASGRSAAYIMDVCPSMHASIPPSFLRRRSRGHTCRARLAAQ